MDISVLRGNKTWQSGCYATAVTLVDPDALDVVLFVDFLEGLVLTNDSRASRFASMRMWL